MARMSDEEWEALMQVLPVNFDTEDLADLLTEARRARGEEKRLRGGGADGDRGAAVTVGATTALNNNNEGGEK